MATSLAKQIAYASSGSEPHLLEALSSAGAVVLRAYPAPSGLVGARQINVRFPDGTVGYFSPGGPARHWTYAWREGQNPDVDPHLRGVPPSDIDKVTFASREESLSRSALHANQARPVDDPDFDRDLLNHHRMFGPSAFVHKRGRSWWVSFRDRGFPTAFKTKTAAMQAMDSWARMTDERMRGVVY